MSLFDDAAVEGNRLLAESITLKADIVTLSAQVLELQSQVADLQTKLDELTSPPYVMGDLAKAAKDAPEGATLYLNGTYEVTTPITPKRGQSFIGPATIVGVGVLDVFNIRPVPNVTLVDLDISGASRHGVACWFGTEVLRCHLHHNGKDGVGGDLQGEDGAAVVVRDCEIDHNGSDEWLGKGAAGVKVFHTRRAVIQGCHVHGNYGNGVWADAHCGDFTVTGNVIENNLRKGAFYEKCGEADGTWGGRTWAIYEGSAIITGNTIINNDTENKPSANAGVSIYASKNAVVSDNNFGGNTRAVIVRNDPARLTDDKHGWVVENVIVKNNDLSGDEIVGCDINGVTCEGNVP